MGKFTNCNIHDRYSTYHWELIKKDAKYKKLYTCDLDRVWVEVQLHGPPVVCFLDLKYDDGPDNTSPTEKVLYKWLEDKGAKIYTVFISQDFKRFRVVNERGQQKLFNPIQYADWLLYQRKK